MRKTKRIFIVGHSGAGKGVLAQALAEKLRFT
jgi:adenylate kinase family enzyme